MDRKLLCFGCLIFVAVVRLTANAQITGTRKNLAVKMVSEPWVGTISTPDLFRPGIQIQVHEPWEPADFAVAKQRADARKRALMQPDNHVALSPQANSSDALVGVVFRGPVDAYYPPDDMVAAGPNHIVASINEVMYIYDKDGNFISVINF